MARIIKKGYGPEEEYYARRRAQAHKSARDIKKFGRVSFVVFLIYVAAVIISVAADKLLLLFLPMTVCFGMILLTAALLCLGDHISWRTDTDILISGMHGERAAANLLATLPDSYTIFQNVMLTYDDRKSEIDNIVVGKSGVFIIEVKNHNGHIVGDLNDRYWTQHKVGRGGTPYTNTLYSPVKQVGTHIYCLANYLRRNGINTYIEGMVYFTNKDCGLCLTGDSGISVYSSSGGDADRLCRRILAGNQNLNSRVVKHICEVIDQI